jgi:Na+/phosphate symporter
MEATMSAYVFVLLLLIGVLLYFVPSNSKLQELGRITFAGGILGAVLHYAGHSAKLLS